MGRQNNVLITGNTGFIGSFLTKRLETIGYHVFGLNTKNGDILDENCITKAVKGMDYVFHLAGLSRPMLAEKNRGLSYNLNVIGTEKVAKACHHYGVKIIFSSSRRVYGNKDHQASEKEPTAPISAYGLHKKLAEYFCNRDGDFIARLSAIYGPSELCHSMICRFIKSIKSKEKIVIYENDKIKRDYCYIDDAVDALLLGMKHSGVYNVASGRETTANEVMSIISNTLGGDYEVVYEKQKAYDIEQTRLDTSKIKKTGWTPRVDLNEGIRRMLNGYS